ncbi:hypothetical protein [Roseovarius amoyensis]|uniref:hypothetical protein n=1 Tax=Roseovarius amoyensis TaxID=2211448 RepID=UPI000DBE4725|nr:hypothetical protein [Roseovarius amoyensis]
MFNVYTAGFVCVAVTAAVGVDFVTQARQAGAGPTDFGLSAYADSVTSRVSGTLGAIDKTRRQSQDAREHLPETVAGWERGKWVRDASGDEEAMRGLGLLEQRALKDRIKASQKAARNEVYEYVRGSDRVRLSARFEPQPDGRARASRVTAFVDPRIDPEGAWLEGFDIIQGVFFFRLIDPKTGLGSDPAGPVMLQAYIGDGVAIGVYADHPVDDLASLLNGIDYDSLNAMLDQPVPHVGSNAPHVPEDQKAEFLEMAAAAYMSDPEEPQASGADASPAPAPQGGQALQGGAEVSRLTPGKAGQAGQGGDGGPKRLTLSGGRSCLDSSSGRLCN